MTWQIAKIQGRLGSTWQVANISGSTAGVSTTWQVAKVGGTTSQSPVSAAPVVSLPATTTMFALGPTPIGVKLVSGSRPTSYVWTTTGGSVVNNGDGTAVVYPPGSVTGGTITVTVVASLSGYADSTASTTVFVDPVPGGYQHSDGTIHLLSDGYRAERALF